MAKLNKEQIALALLTSPTIKAAAQKVNISETTLYRLRRQESFKAILRTSRDDLFNETMLKAQGYCMEALEVLREIMKNDDCSDAARVSAAKTILDMGVNLYEDEVIMKRIENLEIKVNYEGEE